MGRTWATWSEAVAVEQLERAAGFEASDAPETKLDKLVTALAISSQPVDVIAPLVASLLSIPTDGRYPPLNVSPQRQKDLTLDALARQTQRPDQSSRDKSGLR